MEGAKPKCNRCHRPLTDPVSIAFGMGPVCRGKGGRNTSPVDTSPVWMLGLDFLQIFLWFTLPDGSKIYQYRSAWEIQGVRVWTSGAGRHAFCGCRFFERDRHACYHILTVFEYVDNGEDVTSVIQQALDILTDEGEKADD